jgi:hypothetical protein
MLFKTGLKWDISHLNKALSNTEKTLYHYKYQHVFLGNSMYLMQIVPKNCVWDSLEVDQNKMYEPN